MLARNVVGQRFMPFVTDLPKDVLEEMAEERLDLVGAKMQEFQETFQRVQEHDEEQHTTWHSPKRMTPAIKNRLLAMGKEALPFFRQAKHLFMYRKFVDAVEALGICDRKLQLGLEILWGLYGKI